MFPRLSPRLLLVTLLIVAVFALLFHNFSDDIGLGLKSLVATPYTNAHNPISPAVNKTAEEAPPAKSGASDILTPTSIPGGAHVHGFTVLDNLYVRNGTFYVVTSDPASFPPRRNLIARPFEMGGGEVLEPTDEDMQFITPTEAQHILGNHAIRVPDFSFIVYDPGQFMHHFYHWWGEIILGAWRVYSKLSENASHGANKPLPFPARFILPVVSDGEWRDRAGVDGPLMRATFPDASIEQADYWDDLARLDTTIVFERAMLINRETAHRHPFGSRWAKMIAGTMELEVPEDFWEPIRQSSLQSLLGYVPRMDARGHIVDPPHVRTDKPIVTYISRQSGGRRLTDEAHLGLVKALKELEEEGLCELNIAMMENLNLAQQLSLAARSTIIVGVHGNGLTHQLWMPTGERSTVFEILKPPSYVFDYEMLARNVGHRHYAVNNDTLSTYPKGSYHDGLQFGDDFSGVSIPVHGPAIADKIRERLGN